jgi:hypothetical protein
MKILRWILGFPLAAVISMGFFFMAVQYGLRGIYSYQFYFLELLFRVIVIFFCFALWIFLTCFFIPSNKKLAGIIPIAVSTILLVTALYLNARDGGGMHFNQNTIIAFSSFYIGMFMGYFVSYVIFKNKGWNRLKKPVKVTEFDI